jgi:hypothetical protein
MMLYSKNGSIPKTETDGTEGWIEVEVAPAPGPNQEVVWWYPPGWVTRPLQPIKEGFIYDWSQSEEKWVESPAPVVDGALPTIEITLPDMGSASDTIEIQTLTSSTTL